MLLFVRVCLGKEFKSEMHLSLGRVVGMRLIGKALQKNIYRRMSFCECGNSFCFQLAYLEIDFHSKRITFEYGSCVLFHCYCSAKVASMIYFLYSFSFDVLTIDTSFKE